MKIKRLRRRLVLGLCCRSPNRRTEQSGRTFSGVGKDSIIEPLGACRHHIDKKLSMLRKSFVFNCPEGATFSERSLRKSLDSSRAILRNLFVEMAAQQSVTRKKGKEWFYWPGAPAPGRIHRASASPSKVETSSPRGLRPARRRGFYFADCGTVQCPPGAGAPGQY